MAELRVEILLHPLHKPVTINVQNGDKYEHVLAYSVLMFWFCELYTGWKQRAAYCVAWIGLGIAMEYVQRAIGYRTFDVFDMAADAVGVLLGLSVALFADTQPWWRKAVARARRRGAIRDPGSTSGQRKSTTDVCDAP